MEENDKILIITLRAARTNRGYTLDDVSNFTPYSRDKIHKYELDSSNIPYTMLEILLNLYDVQLKNIFLGVESDFIGRFRVNTENRKIEKSCVS